MSNKQKKILLVEDDTSLRELVTMALELEGYEMIVAENGQQAIDYLINNSVDLILLDLFMPVMDGIHVMRWIRDERKLSYPIVVMTAMTDEQTRETVIASGANGIIKKPLDVNQINLSVEKYISR
jgi:DNA-binding response OmpR family regulator